MHEAQKIFSEELRKPAVDPVVWGNVTFAEGAAAWNGSVLVIWPDGDFELLDLTDRIGNIVDRRPTSEISASLAKRA